MTSTAATEGRSTICLINATRARHGLARLQRATPLLRAAGEHSRDMVRRRFFSHVTPEGETPLQRIDRAGFRGQTVGETIAWATDATPRTVVRMWMQSPPHRQVLLDCSYRTVGIGIALGAPETGAGGATFTANLGSA